MVMLRLYDHLLEERFASNRQMAFVSGPGKWARPLPAAGNPTPM